MRTSRLITALVLLFTSTSLCVAFTTVSSSHIMKHSLVIRSLLVRRVPVGRTFATAVASSSSSGEAGSLYFTQEHYKSLQHFQLCNSHIHVVQCPSKLPTSLFQIPDATELGEVYRAELTGATSTGLNVYIGGRVALRRAMLQQTPDDWRKHMITKNPLGAPVLPSGWIGSISHKHNIAIAASRPLAGQDVGHLGVDIEKKEKDLDLKLGKRLLTEYELQTLGNESGLSPEEEVLLRFSFKESLYKALNPYLQRYIQFKEAEVFPHSDGTAEIRLHLNNTALPHSTSNASFVLQRYEASWCLFEDKYFITCVYIL